MRIETPILRCIEISDESAVSAKKPARLRPVRQQIHRRDSRQIAADFRERYLVTEQGKGAA